MEINLPAHFSLFDKIGKVMHSMNENPEIHKNLAQEIGTYKTPIARAVQEYISSLLGSAPTQLPIIKMLQSTKDSTNKILNHEQK